MTTVLATYANIQKKTFRSKTTTFYNILYIITTFFNNITFLNDNLNETMKIVKPLEDSFFLIKGVTETVENEVKQQKGQFLDMVAATLGANLLRKC